jgi:hypothetical protein
MDRNCYFGPGFSSPMRADAGGPRVSSTRATKMTQENRPVAQIGSRVTSAAQTRQKALRSVSGARRVRGGALAVHEPPASIASAADRWRHRRGREGSSVGGGIPLISALRQRAEI